MNTKMSILILHARDDIVIPFKLGEKVKYKQHFDYNLYIILNKISYFKNDVLICLKFQTILCTIVNGFYKIFMNLI